LATVAAIAILACAATPAFAGQASSGQLFFYPCTSCHPLTTIPGTEKATKPLPNNFPGHGIVLEGHTAMGKGHAACPTCHDDQSRNPGMLKAADGTLIDIKSGDLSLVCYRCHSTKWKEFKAGTHGKHKASCVAEGCHDPHTPQFIFAAAQKPFVGTGWQFRILPVRAPFKALMGPAPDPATIVPGWYVALAVFGVCVVGGLIGVLVSGRFKR
jgi:hypothetical protein